MSISQAVIPPDLVTAFKERRAAMFIGAGVSISAGLPDWNTLASHLAQQLGISPDLDGRFSPSMLPLIPQYFANTYGAKSLYVTVDRLLKPAVPWSMAHSLIAQLPCDLFYTTNLDMLLENALQSQHRSFDLVLDDDTARRYMERRAGDRQVRKIHGSIGFASSYILTRAQYARFEYERPVLTQALRHDLSSFNFLFVGYSLNDPDFNSIYEHVLVSMGEMAPRHYALLISPSTYEVDDLERRGITTIDLSLWPGDTPAAKLETFLQKLVDSSSMLVHVERLFKLPGSRHVPIILSSKLNEEEGYVYHTACDIHTATKIQSVLEMMEIKSTIMADTAALENVGEILSDNVILVCSPFANTFTQYVFDQAQKLKCSITHRFIIEGGKRQIIDARGTRWVSSDTLNISHSDSADTLRDYALVARYRNPWAPSKYIYVFCGIYTLGTEAAGDIVAKPEEYSHLLPLQSDEFAAIVELEYKEFNPHKYEYQLGKVYCD